MTDTQPAGRPGSVAQRVAAIAGIFSVVVLTLLIGNALVARSADPFVPARLRFLQAQLSRDRTNESLKKEARRVDADLRTAFVRHRTFGQVGLYLLLGGIVSYLVALELSRTRADDQPTPDPSRPQTAWVERAVASRSVVGLGAGLAAVLVTLALLSRHDVSAGYALESQAPQPAGHPAQPPAAAGPASSFAGGALPPAAPSGGTSLAPIALPGASAPATPSGGALSSAPLGAAPTAAVPAPAPGTPAPGAGPPTRAVTAVVAPQPADGPLQPLYPADWSAQWPRFRGPGGDGVATVREAPTKWDGASGAGIAWKAAVPLPGWNSPVVWGDHVYLSGASASRREVFCFALGSGRLLWRRPVGAPAGGVKVKVMADTGYAPSTLATDGRHVAAIFVDGAVACFGADGKPLWTRALGAPVNVYGHASSLAIYGAGLIVQFDQGSAPEDGKSVLMALDLRTGRTVWEIKRPVPNAWSTPLLARAGRREMIVTTASPWVIAHDPRTGAEIWRAKALGGEVAASATLAGGLVVAANTGAQMVGIRPDGVGDVTASAIVWTSADYLPDTASPVGTKDLVFVVVSEGLVAAIDAATGKKVWEQEIPAMLNASPIVVGGHVYLTDKKGVTHIFEAGRVWREIASPALGEEVRATPAFVGKRIVVRGAKNLYCIGATR